MRVMNYILCCLCLFTGTGLAQTADSLTAIPSEANRKDWPVELRPGEWDLNTAFKNRPDPKSPVFKNAKFKKVQYTSAQLERITYLMKRDELPQGLKGKRLTENRALLPYYKSYWVGNVSIDGSDWCLIHIPQKENQHMPAELIPETGEGIYFTAYYNAAKFRNFTLAGTKPPEPSVQLAQRQSNGVQFTEASLSRWERSSGVFILWYGEGTTARQYRAFSVEFASTVSEQSIAADLQKNTSASYGYLGYTFKKGYTCRDTYAEVARKMGLSANGVQDLRLGYCSDATRKYEN